MKRLLFAALLAVSPIYAQTTPSLKLNIPPISSAGWALKINANFTSLDQFLSGAKPLTSITLSGPITGSTQAATKAYVDAAVHGGCGFCITALTGDVAATGGGSQAATVKGLNGVLLSSLATGILKVTAGVPSIATAGTDFLLPSRNLSDLPSASTARTNLGLGTAATMASSAFDVAGAAAAAQTAAQTHAANAANLTSGTIPTARIPTLNQNTTGNAATASALAATPSICSTGQAAQGVLPNGNATGCFTPPGGGGTDMVYPSGTGLAVVTGGTSWGTTLTPPTGTIVGTTDIQTLINKTVDGVTPATFAFIDPTSSIQTQLNSKQASLGFTPVANTITVNGHALSSNVIVSATDLTTGTLPHAQLPTLLSADIPNNASSTTGLSAGVSGSQTANFVYAAPNGAPGVLGPRALVAADIPSLNYQIPITLTTTGTSGASTLIGGTLNVPQYAGGGGGAVYPTGSGIPIVVSGTSWGTTVAAPASAIVGISDTQTLTNKSIAASQLTGSSFPLTFTTAGGLTTAAGGVFGTAAFTASGAYDAAGAAATAQTAATAAFTGDVVKTAGNFATTVTRINGTALAGLATGILKNTTTTGIPTIAISGTDYQAPLTLTTTGSGSATLTGAILNIPNSSYTLPTASPSVLGGVMVDNSTITVTGGVISAHTSGTGTVTSVSSGNLSPLFTTSVATSTSTPALSFALSTAAANTVFGNFTGSTAAPTFTAAPVFSAANLTSFPTFNQSTTGTAAGIAGGATGSLHYQSAANTTAFLASPTTTGHTFVPVWQPSGSAIAPTTLDLATYLSSPPSIGSVTPGAGAFTTLSSTSAMTVGGSVPTACGSATGCLAFNEAGTLGTPTAAMDYIRADSTTHSLRASVNGGTEFSLGSGGSGSPGGSAGQIQYNNAGAFGGFTASGDATITPSTGAVVVTKTNGTAFSGYATATYVLDATTTVGTQTISANSCGSEVDVTMTGFTTGMTAQFTPSTDVSSVTGWSPSGGQLYFSAWAKATNTVAYKLCNPTAAGITIGSSTTWNISAK